MSSRWLNTAYVGNRNVSYNKSMAFQRLAMDLIGKTHPSSSLKHEWILVAMDYFIKWVEAILLRRVDVEAVIKFIKEGIIHKFGIPETITTDQGFVLTSAEFKEFADQYHIRLLRSSLYYTENPITPEEGRRKGRISPL